MSFGYGIGDIVLLTRLAWKTYKACKDASASFANLAQETQSLHAILQETEEVLRDSHTKLSLAQLRRLQAVTDGCRSVLSDLDALLQKYESLGTQSKLSWDRMGYATKDIAELRSRLTSHTLLLSSFIQTSQVVVEQKLRKLIKEVQEGKHEASQLSAGSLDSLAVDKRKRWRTIRKQLEGVGITIAAFEENSTFIIDFIKDAIASGALEEKAPAETSSTTATTAATQTSTTIEEPSKPGTIYKAPPSPARKRFSISWKKRSPATDVSPILEQRWNRGHKVLMLGISEAGKTTVLNQTRLLSSPTYHPGEYNDCRMLFWNTLLDNFISILDQLQDFIDMFQHPPMKAIVEVYSAQRLETGDEIFPIDTMDALHVLWDESAIRKIIDRSCELGIFENLEYLYKNMERIAHPKDTPSNDDILNMRVKTLGVSETFVEFDRDTYRIFDVPGERVGRQKWLRCFDGGQARCVVFVASLTGYCSFVESEDPAVKQLDESLCVFKNLVASKWFPESIFVLFLTKLDKFEQRMRRYPLDAYDWSEKNSVSDGLAFIANKFVALAEENNRILQVHCINATSPLSQECLKGALRFVSCTVPGRPAKGSGKLMPCPYCQMGDLFSLDHFEAPSEALDLPHDNEAITFSASARKARDEAVPPQADYSWPLLPLAEAEVSKPIGALLPAEAGVSTSVEAYEPNHEASPQSLDWDKVHVKTETVTQPSA